MARQKKPVHKEMTEGKRNINSPAVNKLLGLLPDRLLRVGAVINWFDLYELGGRVTGAIPLLLALYSVLTILLWPVIYQGYRHTQIG